MFSKTARWCATAVGSAALAATLGAGAANAVVAPPTVTSVTHVVNRSDGGNGGTWATDYFYRRGTLTELGSVDGTNCGGASADTCYGYTLSIKDAGWKPWVPGKFITLGGQLTPNQSGEDQNEVIGGDVTGTFTGHASFAEFYTSSLPTGGSNGGVATYVNGDTPTTSSWPSLYFPNTATLYGVSINPWSWSYNATVKHRHEHWVDASTNNYGNSPGDGNIEGYAQ